MTVLISGLGVLAYVVGTLTRTLVEGQLLEVMGRKKLEREIQKLKGHYVICGYGRVGQIICEEIKKARPTPLVVIDNNDQVAAKVEEDGFFFISGDATDEECLLRAGTLNAKALVTALDSEADNVYITITAKGLNPKLYILARAGRIGSEKKLIHAGANVVVSPHQIGGFRMAQALLRPAVTEFFDFTLVDPHIAFTMEQIPVSPASTLSDVALIDYNPASHTRIEIGDTLIALGQKSNLIELSRLLGNTEL
jgi:voltage-gated potassium channel